MNSIFDSICYAFEQSFQAGQSPEIDEFLKRGDEESRGELLGELVQIELWWRRADASPPAEEQFLKRFPNDGDVIREAFRLYAERTAAPAALQANQLQSYAAHLESKFIQSKSSGKAREESTTSKERFGRYELLKELGRGGMGVVYLAHDEMLDRKVALKIPTFREAGRDEMLARFYREARAAAALRDPGICPVYDVGEIDGQAFISMAFIEGRSLRDYTKSGKPQDPKVTARVIRRLAIAMAEAHAAGILHRDLKPANIMMEKGRRPVIMDFGLAYSSVEMESRLTGSGAILGTPAYMSPEQAAGDTNNITATTDIYSLGVIFYEMLTGRVPYEGNVMAVLTQIATRDPKPLSEYELGIDESLVAIVDRMMAKPANDRFAAMAEVVDALTSYLREESTEGEQLEAAESPADGGNPQSQSLQPLTGASLVDSGSTSAAANRSSTRGPAASATRPSVKPRAKQPAPSGGEASVEEFADAEFDEWDDDEDEYGDRASSRRRSSSRRAGRGRAKSTKTARRAGLPLLAIVSGGAVIGAAVLIGAIVLLRDPTGKNQEQQSVAQATADAATHAAREQTAAQPGGGNSSESSTAAPTPERAASSAGSNRPAPVRIADASDQNTPPGQGSAPTESAANPSGLVFEPDPRTIGQLAPFETRTAPRADYLPKFRFPRKAGQPLDEWSLVSRPGRVNQILSWSIEPRRSQALACDRALDVHRDGLIAAGFKDGRVRLYDADMRLIRIHAEHAARVDSVGFSPDGVWLAALSSGPSVAAAARPETQEPPGRLLVWDVRCGQKVAEFATAVWQGPLAWSPDSSVLAIGGTEAIELLNLGTGKSVSLGKLNAYPLSMAWSPHGDRLAVSYEDSGDPVRVYDARTLEVVREINKEVGDNVNRRCASLDWSPDGRWLAFNDGQLNVRVFETNSLTLERTLPQPRVFSLQFSPDSTQLLCISLGNTTSPETNTPVGSVTYDTRTWTPMTSEPALTSDYPMHWLPDSDRIVGYRRLENWLADVRTVSVGVSSDGSRLATRVVAVNEAGYRENSLIQIWDGATGSLVSGVQVKGPGVDHACLRWQPGGVLLALLNRQEGTQPTALRLLDSATGEVVHRLEGHTGKIWELAWSPDGQQLASVGEDSTCRIWDASSGQEVAALQHTKEQCWLTWSSDGKRIACGSPFSDVTVWDAKTWEQERVFRTLKRAFGKPYDSQWHCPFGFLKDSTSLFVIGNANGFELANVKTGAVLDAGQADPLDAVGDIFGLEWSPDFQTMYVCGGYHALRLLTPGRKGSRLIRYASQPAWLSDSRRIVAGTNAFSPITGYDTRTGNRLGVLLPALSKNQWAMIGPDGHFTSSPEAAEHLVVTAILEDGRCVTLTLEEFEQQYGWKNDPDKARFLNRN